MANAPYFHRLPFALTLAPHWVAYYFELVGESLEAEHIQDAYAIATA